MSSSYDFPTAHPSILSRLKVLSFNCLLLPCIGLIVWTVNAQGARIAISPLATKLYRVPLVVMLGLGRYRLFHELDVAPFFAIVILVFVYISTILALRAIMYGPNPNQRGNHAFRCYFVFSIAAVLLLFDAILFYLGLAEMSFLRRGSGGFVALIATLGYSVALLFAAYLDVTLKGDA